MSLQKNIKLLTWFNFFTDFKLYAPIAIIYFSHVSHSYALGASIFSIAMITSAFFDVPTGIYSDIIGRKRTIILGAFFAVLAVTSYAIGLNYWSLAVGGFFEGISRAFYSGNNNALLHGMLAGEGLEHEFHTYLGKLSAMFQVALATAGLLGGIIATFSFPIVMWLSVIPQVVCLLIGTQIIDTQTVNKTQSNIMSHMKAAMKSFATNANLRLLSLSSIFSYAIGESGYQFQAAFFQTVWPVWAVGFAKFLTNVFAAISFYFAGSIIKRFGALKVLLFGDAYATVVNILSTAFPTIISPAIMVTPSLLYGNGVTAENTLLQKEFTDEQRATMSSLNSFMGSLVFAVFVFATGLFADKLSPAKSLLIFQTMYIGVVLLQFKLFRQVKAQANLTTASLSPTL